MQLPDYPLPVNLKIVFLASRVRTGSSYINDLAGNTGLMDAIGELFNPESNKWLNQEAMDFLKTSGLPCGKSDAELISAVRNNPVKGLGLAVRARQQNRSLAVVKLMHTCPDVKHLPSLFAIRQAHGVVFTARKMIDCLISFEKAKTSRTWENLDTTDQKPEIDIASVASEFERWHEWTTTAARMAIAAALPVGRLEYEKDILPSARLAIARFFEEARLKLGITGGIASFFAIQDRNTDWRKKISNPDEIEAEIRRCGVEPAYFKPFPAPDFLARLT